jgi:hypothetical protein
MLWISMMLFLNNHHAPYMGWPQFHMYHHECFCHHCLNLAWSYAVFDWHLGHNSSQNPWKDSALDLTTLHTDATLLFIHTMTLDWLFWVGILQLFVPFEGNNYQTSPISACTLSPIQANSPIKIKTKCSCLPSPSSIYFILLLHWSCWSVTGFPVIWVFLEANAKFSQMISYSTSTGVNQAFLWAIVYSYKRKNLRKKWYIKVTRWMTLVK